MVCFVFWKVFSALLLPCSFSATGADAIFFLAEVVWVEMPSPSSLGIARCMVLGGRQQDLDDQRARPQGHSDRVCTNLGQTD